jgi:hypothetical protein
LTQKKGTINETDVQVKQEKRGWLFSVQGRMSLAKKNGEIGKTLEI